MALSTFHLFLQNLLVIAAMALLMTLCGECAEVPQGMSSSAYNHSALLANSSQEGLEAPRIQRLQKPCKPEHKDFCIHGECIYTTDEDKPTCECSSASGPRCEHFLLESDSIGRVSLEEIIGICLGVALLLVCLAGAIYCCMRKRCQKESLPYQTYDSKEAV
ncbi:hypothetical protein ACEWY4_012410 [Coilia grayii]|uniref:EGF-like domain-containing protein n=1 Tax=Coilia grayii TaxID=363190 RepID=A0ABD1K0F2_9TELE